MGGTLEMDGGGLTHQNDLVVMDGQSWQLELLT